MISGAKLCSFKSFNFPVLPLEIFKVCRWSIWAGVNQTLPEDLRGDITTWTRVFKTKLLQSLWKAIFQHTWTMTQKTQGRVSGCLLFCRKRAMQYRFSKAHDQSKLSDHTALRLSPGYTLKTHNQACLLFPQVWVFGLSHLVWFSSSEVEL